MSASIGGQRRCVSRDLLIYSFYAFFALRLDSFERVKAGCGMKCLSCLRSAVLCVVLVTSHGPIFAATSDDLADIRNQLHELTERVNRLEQENASLKQQNAALKGNEQSVSAPKEPAEKRAQAVSAEAPSLADRIALSADFRYRFEDTSDDTLNASGIRTADRYRDRIRARISANFQAAKDVTIGMGIATGDGDPRSTTQTLGDIFSHKSVGWDLA